MLNFQKVSNDVVKWIQNSDINREGGDIGHLDWVVETSSVQTFPFLIKIYIGEYFVCHN